jgi:RimJ/RimL family protein N-acetyltransferase
MQTLQGSSQTGKGRMTSAPDLFTDRLLLRAHQLEDYTALCALWSDPDVARFTTGQPTTSEQSWARLLRYAGHWQLLGFGYWAVVERASGHFIGDFGFADYQRLIEPTLDGSAEMGWVLASAFQGKGYAEEATRSILQWADGHLARMPITCIIDPANHASIRLAAKLGFVETALAQYGDKAMRLYHLRREPAQS